MNIWIPGWRKLLVSGDKNTPGDTVMSRPKSIHLRHAQIAQKPALEKRQRGVSVLWEKGVDVRAWRHEMLHHQPHLPGEILC